MTHTKYSNLTDDEFLGQVDDARSKSPIIDELATRLEKANRQRVPEDSDTRVDCPVCEASLVVSYDETTNRFKAETE
ncbi:MAG: hypothetical protein A2Y38_19810 [Spirochaetes bacterium GWB1_59_5]|nr:MAG: hypothetical protein A2Y38_19810 [Spirochaetes bacterium GWB1_59_5]